MQRVAEGHFVYFGNLFSSRIRGRSAVLVSLRPVSQLFRPPLNSVAIRNWPGRLRTKFLPRWSRHFDDGTARDWLANLVDVVLREIAVWDFSTARTGGLGPFS